MRKIPTFVTATALAAALGVTTAVASPPSGQFTFTDHVRAAAVDPGSLQMPSGTGVSSTAYTLGAGTTSGWREIPGTALLALTQGTLTVQSAQGCASREYTAGQAAVVPAGVHQLRNGGSGPVGFVGVFLTPGAAADDPITASAAAPTPAGCGEVTAFSGGDLTAAPLGAATFVPAGSYSHAAPADEPIRVEPGKDILVSTYVVEPGTSFGWHTHPQPYIGVITRGTLTYYEGHGGKCELAGVYSAGQAFSVIPGEGHQHLGGNYGDETLEVYGVYVNMASRTPVPMFGNQLDANDFSPTPPADCPKLRDSQF